MVEALNKRFPEEKLNFAIGGQISIDVFPQVSLFTRHDIQVFGNFGSSGRALACLFSLWVWVCSHISFPCYHLLSYWYDRGGISDTVCVSWRAISAGSCSSATGRNQVATTLKSIPIHGPRASPLRGPKTPWNNFTNTSTSDDRWCPKAITCRDHVLSPRWFHNDIALLRHPIIILHENFIDFYSKVSGDL